MPEATRRACGLSGRRHSHPGVLDVQPRGWCEWRWMDPPTRIDVSCERCTVWDQSLVLCVYVEINWSKWLRGLIKLLLNKGIFPRKENPSVDVIHLKTYKRTVWEGHVMGSEQPLPGSARPCWCGATCRNPSMWRACISISEAVCMGCCFIKPPFKIYYSVLHVLACYYITAHWDLIYSP